MIAHYYFRMHPLLNEGWTYSEETIDQFRARYARFGSGFFDYLSTNLPTSVQCLRYLRALDHQTGDAFAVSVQPHTFAIRLDPGCEVICRWDENIRTEIGYWSTDPYQDTMNFIRDHFEMSSGAEQNGAFRDQGLRRDKRRGSMNGSIAITSGIRHGGSRPAMVTMNHQHKTNEARQATGGWRAGPISTPLPPAPAF